MTVSSTTTFEILEATGTKDPYPFNIEIIKKGDVKVKVDDKSLDYKKDYDIKLNSFNKSGYIVFLKDFPKKEQKILVERRSKMIQSVTFTPNVNFNEKNIELMGDKIVLQTQEIKQDTKRALKFPIDLKEIITDLPYPIPGKALVWNKDGKKLINSDITPGGGGTDFIPNPQEGNVGDLLRINDKKSSYELFNLGIKEPNKGNINQILRVDKNSYEFADLPIFPNNDDENVGKIPILSKKDEFKYVKSDEKELVASLEFEKTLTYGSSRSDDLQVDSNGFNGTKYELDFIYDKLNLKEKEVKVFIYLIEINRIKISDISTGNFTRFLIEFFNEKFNDLEVKFEFSVEKLDKKYYSSKTIKDGIHDLLLQTSNFPYHLKVKASIYKILI